MAQQLVNVGTAANDATGDPLRTAFQKTNSNFSELYGLVGTVTTVPPGLVGNGVANDGTTIQNTLNSLSTNGGTVALPPGTYAFNSLNIPAKVNLQGAGANATILKLLTTTGNGITIGSSGTAGSYSTINNVQVTTAAARTNGAAISVVNSHYIFIQKVVFSGIHFDAIALEGGSSQYEYFIYDCEFGTCNEAGIVVGRVAPLVQETFIANCIFNCGANGGGLLIVDASGIYLSNLSIITSSYGIGTFPPAGGAVKYLRMYNCLVDSCHNEGVRLWTNGGDLRNVQMFNMGSQGSVTAHGLSLTPSPGTSAGVSIIGGEFVSNHAAGIAVFGGINLIINGVAAWNNITAGIEIDPGVSQFQIQNSACGTFGTSGSITPGYGILINTGSSDKYIITGNRTPGNTTGISDGGTGTNKIVVNNGNW